MGAIEPVWWPLEYRAGRQIKRTHIHALTVEDALREAKRLLHWGRDFKSISGETMTQTATSDVRSISLDDLHLSKTHAQVERRKHIDARRIDELAGSIVQLGVLQPIIVRPLAGNGSFEVVAGECRFMAAKKAKLETILCSVREFTDEQAIEVQLIENLQRQDLHELAEAEAYEQLLGLGFTAEQIADKVSKSKATIYARMKLLALCKEARTAFYADKLSASHALLLARIPAEPMQKEALKEILKGRYGNDGPMSYRDAARYVHDTFMLRLADAGFPTGDADLVPAAGPCGTCPKRTGNQPELFNDVKGADVCTDPSCFKAKIEAWGQRQRAAAEESGQRVISGADAKKIARYGVDRGALEGYVRLDETDYLGGKSRSYRSIIGKDVKPDLLQDPESGKLIEVISDKTANAAIKAKGFKDVTVGDSYRAEQSAREKKAKRETVYRTRVYQAVLAKVPAKLARADLEAIARSFFNDVWHDARTLIIRAWGWQRDDKDKKLTHEDLAAREIPKLSDVDVSRFLFGLTLARELKVSSYGQDTPTELNAMAKRFKVNADSIRRQLAAEEKAKRKPKATK